MSMLKKATLAVIALAACVTLVPERADAAYRQYYSSWTYYPSRTYYVRKYYYKPAPTYTDYSYHYCVHYPSQPRYVYYYNPVRRYYWGRFDTQGKEGAQYSLLAEKDRKESLDDIPESAFPAPGKMPAIPDAEDGVAIEPVKDLPEKSKEQPQDLPGE
jgi:hypothetical protein